MTSRRLKRDFFERPTVQVAQDLLGKVLFFKGYQGRITETEAYIGQEDAACHASKGRTPRTEVLFGQAGISYVYFIYGMYHCLNFVTEKEGYPAAVLVRAIQMEDIPLSALNGPGKVCRYLGMTTHEHNRIDVTLSPDFYVLDGTSLPFEATPRIGIRVAMDKLWRFVAKKI
jgi:DNA-3-methyladenine glycosylase